MSDEPLRFEYRISRSAGLSLAFHSALLAALAIWDPFDADYASAAVFGAGSMVLARWSLRGFLTSRHSPWHLQLMDDRIVVPSLFAILRVSDRVLRFEQLTSVLYWKCTDHFKITLRGKATAVEVFPGMFASREQFDSFLATLTGRLETCGVPIERREVRFTRPQFSLQHLLLATTLVAAVLGFLMYFEMQEVLLPALAMIGFAIAMDGMAYGPWWMRAFRLGVIIGLIAEIVSLLVMTNWMFLVAPAIGGKGGFYPFTRLFWPNSPLANLGRLGFVLSVLSGLLVSTVVFGGLAVAVSAVMRKRGRRQK